MSSNPHAHGDVHECEPAAPEPDELDFDRFAQAQDPLDMEAAAWVARQRGGLDARGQAELQAWLDRDPRHRAAYDGMNDTLGRLRKEVPPQALRSLKSRPGKRGWFGWLAGGLPRLPRAAMAACVLLLAGACWLGWHEWQHRPRFTEQFATAPGQSLHVALPDGSRLQLDAATRISVRFYADRRELALNEGQAYFDVEADGQRPFLIDAGDVRVAVVGTRFTVRHTQSGLNAGDTRVAVEQGHVRLLSKSGVRLADLTAGQSALAGPRGAWARVQPVGAGGVAPWQNGRIDFVATPLRQALAEFQRYGAPVVAVPDPEAAALPVGGSFRVDNFAGFLDTLTLQLPVRLERRGETQALVLVR